MKPIHLIILLFSLQLSTFVTTTTAKDIVSASSWLANLHPRAGDPDSKPSAFICESASSSPFNNHVIFGINEMREKQGHHWCIQENRKGSMCIQLIDYGTASITMCGEYRIKLRCSLIADAIEQLSKACAINFGGKLRVAGRATFRWGYVEISGKRVLDTPVSNQ